MLFIGLQFIGLGPDDLQRYAAGGQPFIGFAVDGKTGMTQVDEEAQDAEVFRGRDVFTDESTPAVAVLAAGLGKAVTRQIDQEKGKAPLPFFFIATPQGGLEIVDGLGLPRRAADPGQAAVAAEGIDQARLADVRAATSGRLFVGY